MQSFKSAVFSVVVSLFLAVSLVACSDEGGIPASQSGENGSSLFESSDVKLVLKPGSKYINIRYSVRGIAKKQAEAIRSMLQEKGILVEDVLAQELGSSEGMVSVQLGQIQRETTLTFGKEHLKSFEVQSSFWEDMAQWEPSYGNEARYAD